MKNGSQDFSSIFPNDDKVFSRLPSRVERYNTSKLQGEASFRVLYYGGATGSVPFLWESQPGTPKHKFSDSPLPPLTPPPQFQSSSRASPTSRKKHSKIFNSIFTRTTSSSKKMINALSLSSSSSSSYSSSYSSPSTPVHSGKGNTKARLSPIKFGFGLEGNEYEPETNSPTSTLCFRHGNGGSSSSRRAKSVKKVVMSIAGRRISNNY